MMYCIGIQGQISSQFGIKRLMSINKSKGEMDKMFTYFYIVSLEANGFISILKTVTS